ncbi:MAG: DMT family transporter [Pseudomonadota bacterium]
MTRTLANLLLVAIALIWGLAFIYQKTAMAHVGPLLFVAIRSAIACVVLLPLALFERRSRTPKIPLALWQIGAFGGAMFFLAAALQQIGMVTATVTNTGFLTGLYVVVTPLIVWALFANPPARHIWAAVGFAFTGTWFLGGGTVGGLSTGDVLVAISSIFWAGHIVVIERSTVHASPTTFTMIQFLVTGVLGLCAATIFEPIVWSGIIAALPELLFVGVLSSALTFTLMAVAMRSAASSEAAIIVSLETVFAALFAAVMLGERLSLVGWIGAALLFSATLIVQGYPYVKERWRRSR